MYDCNADETAWKIDEDATADAQEVFGSDVVKRAYIEYHVPGVYDQDDPDWVSIDLAGSLRRILLELTNQKWVEINASEWGQIRQHGPLDVCGREIALETRADA